MFIRIRLRYRYVSQKCALSRGSGVVVRARARSKSGVLACGNANAHESAPFFSFLRFLRFFFLFGGDVLVCVYGNCLREADSAN